LLGLQFFHNHHARNFGKESFCKSLALKPAPDEAVLGQFLISAPA
jgi:hypothetical protein